MALIFPASPAVGDLYTANGKTWKWVGTSWISFNTLDSEDITTALGYTPLTSPTSEALVVNNTVSHQGLVLTAGNNIDQLITITANITMTTDWQDTGITGSNLATGTYLVQLFANDAGAGGTNINEYYTGAMSWYAGATNSSNELPTDEIVLHRAGASSDGALYLRTFRAALGSLKLQIYSNLANASSSNYVFKFRRMI